jgi:hypothetical protein
MTKIILGYEKLELRPAPTMYKYSNWAFNGRVEPSRFHVNLEEFKSNAYQLSLHKLIYFPESVDYSSGYNLPFWFDNSNQIEYRTVDSIKDEVYFYTIPMYGITTYTAYNSHIAISEKVLTDIRNKQAYLLFTYESEGDLYTPNYFDKFNTLVQDLNLPKDMIYVIHGDFSIDKFKNCSFSYKPVNSFPWWLHQYKHIAIPEYTPKYLFNCYNRRPRDSRVIIMGLLHEANLLKNSIYSFGNNSRDSIEVTNIRHQNQLSVATMDYLASIANYSPDNKDLITDNPALNIVAEHYQNTFLSLVNETLASASDIMFFSEKIYKPIIMEHPFILFSGYKNLEKFKEFGFKTFDKWWDESYDNEPIMLERVKKIVAILSELDNLSDSQLIDLRKEMLPVLKHNKQVYLDIVSRSKYLSGQPMYDLMCELLKNNVEAD